jgi:hypothetical protein
MNFVLQINFDVTVKATAVTATPVLSAEEVVTLPPYGKWVAFNALT